MIKVSVEEAEGHLGKLIKEATAGQEVVITGAGSSTVRLVPLHESVPIGSAKTIGHSLDHLFGSWSAEEEAEFLESIEEFERITALLCPNRLYFAPEAGAAPLPLTTAGPGDSTPRQSPKRI